VLTLEIAAWLAQHTKVRHWLMLLQTCLSPRRSPNDMALRARQSYTCLFLLCLQSARIEPRSRRRVAGC